MLNILGTLDNIMEHNAYLGTPQGSLKNRMKPATQKEAPHISLRKLPYTSYLESQVKMSDL